LGLGGSGASLDRFGGQLPSLYDLGHQDL